MGAVGRCPHTTDWTGPPICTAVGDFPADDTRLGGQARALACKRASGLLHDGGRIGHPARHRLINLPRPISSRCNRAMLGGCPAVGVRERPQTRSRVVLRGEQVILEAVAVEQNDAEFGRTRSKRIIFRSFST